jgi:CubicO group peptidase (beta-lactamase class C family)
MLLAACGQPATPVASPAAAEPFGAVRSRIEQLLAAGEVPSMAVAVALDGAILWEQGFGLADREDQVPATEHTLYPLASISKPFTATGLMVLVERGLVDLDRPIDDYLGEARLQARVGDAEGATVRRVASHTAGLPLHSQHFYDGEPRRPPSMNVIIERYGNLVTAPGERYQYSNLGYGLLGFAISRVSDQSYADFVREEVFLPLGLTDTVVHTGAGPEAHQAVKYTPEGLVVPPCDSDSPGASAIYASAHDLVHFGMFHLKATLPGQKEIISQAAIDEMQRSSPETGPTEDWERAGSGYGLGWKISVMEDGLRIIHHDGGTHGVSTVLVLVPEENVAVAVLSNTHSQWPDLIAIEILRALLPDRLGQLAPSGEDAAAAPFSPDQALVGLWDGLIDTYEGEVPITVEIEGSGSIYVTLGEQPRTLLRDASYEDDFPEFMSAGDGPFLRGWFQSELATGDVQRGKPCRLWLELKLRDQMLSGSLIAFSQRDMPTGPLAHWVVLGEK